MRRGSSKDASVVLALLGFLLTSVYGYAGVSAEEAKQLGTTLTFWGAEKAGNKEGTIPPYTGENVNFVSADPKKVGYPDPWNEKPLFSITAKNAAQYADKIDGMLEMFKRFPNFRMDIYPSHRTGNYDNFGKQYVSNTLKNATECRATSGGNRLEGCYAGTPFPIPKTGHEEMWNRLLGPGNYSISTDGAPSWVIPQSGSPVLETSNVLWEQNPIYNPATMDKPMGPDDIYFIARVDVIAPARAAGTKYIFSYPIDLSHGARDWTYIPGQRRVKLSPDLSYDTPTPLSGGSQLMDEGQGFTGAMDRFDYKLLGKKEKYIMYNNFTLSDRRVCPDSKVTATKGFGDPDCVRWELHRVWMVEATLKPGFRHVYKRRMYFWDEDTTTGSTEGYDASGRLYRILNLVEIPMPGGGYNSTTTMESDLQTGIWTYQGSWGQEGAPWIKAPPHDKNFFSPEALAGEGIR